MYTESRGPDCVLWIARQSFAFFGIQMTYWPDSGPLESNQNYIILPLDLSKSVPELAR
jgi:hypothetical protein